MNSKPPATFSTFAPGEITDGLFTCLFSLGGLPEIYNRAISLSLI